MSEPSPRFWSIFFELYEGLPRQGPGNRASAQRALALCRDLPPRPTVLDLGCGVGAQTFHLVELTDGTITAVDKHAPSIERLRRTIAERGLEERVKPMVADMGALGVPPESVDLIWSEGALYNLGIESALALCYGLLRPGGSLAFTDAVWRMDNPPPEVKAGFDFDYPTMGRVPDVLAAIAGAGFVLVDHFTLPDEAWWDDFYTPMARRIDAMRGTYADDAEALGILDELAKEPEIHRNYSDTYAYEFFVARKPS
ncbi:MAG: class I SAM-dependent methyltransferase [Planctomycetota bacterium]|nr:class I SAM-dependent methyltransferase [Planctomycetota bacterium]